MIPNNVIQRVFQLKYREQAGTCFTIEHGGQQYFVTAKHVVQTKDEQGNVTNSLQAGDQVEILREGNWLGLDVFDTGYSEQSDISIFRAQQNFPAHPMPATTKGIVYGQDLYFLGFPYGLSSVVGEVNRNFPLPFVKKGILSSMFNAGQGGMFFIDGHNNPGFSGGPVVFKHQADNQFKVAGVVHGYQPEFQNIDGQLTPIENTNSNIIIAYSIANAIELIQAP
jgi:hypothetical protein